MSLQPPWDTVVNIILTGAALKLVDWLLGLRKTHADVDNVEATTLATMNRTIAEQAKQIMELQASLATERRERMEESQHREAQIRLLTTSLAAVTRERDSERQAREEDRLTYQAERERADQRAAALIERIGALECQVRGLQPRDSTP